MRNRRHYCENPQDPILTTDQQTGVYPDRLPFSIILHRCSTAKWRLGAVGMSTDRRGGMEETDRCISRPTVPSHFLPSSASPTLGKSSSIAIATDRGYMNQKFLCQRLARTPTSKPWTDQVEEKSLCWIWRS